MTRKNLGNVEKLVAKSETKRSRRLLSGEVELLLALYKEGVSSGYLAAKFGVSKQAVCKHLKNHGIEVRDRKHYVERYYSTMDEVVMRKTKRGLLK